MAYRWPEDTVFTRLTLAVEEPWCRTCGGALTINWLQVLDTAERSQVDQRIRQQLHPIVPVLDTFTMPADARHRHWLIRQSI